MFIHNMLGLLCLVVHVVEIV